MLKEKLRNQDYTIPLSVPDDIPHGDMPGDIVRITKEYIAKANVIFPILIEELKKYDGDKIVICVCGGSGVGKTAISSILAYYLNSNGIGTYVMSGDNYPRRIPMYNDAERIRIYREGALRGMARENILTPKRLEVIFALQKEDRDADKTLISKYPWLESYIRNGRASLAKYLGSRDEIDFNEVQGIVEQFKSGQKEIWLRRLGRDATSLWYEKVNFSDIDVLIIEWTHGNSDNYSGVDLPIFLNSTPQETLAHRRARNRDKNTDSPFTEMVLEIEQEMLRKQAYKAKIILSKSGELLSYRDYLRIVEEANGQN